MPCRIFGCSAIFQHEQKRGRHEIKVHFPDDDGETHYLQCNEDDCDFAVSASTKSFITVMQDHQFSAHGRGIQCRFCPKVTAKPGDMASHEPAHGFPDTARRSCRRCNWLFKEAKFRPKDRRRHMLEFHEGEEWESKG